MVALAMTDFLEASDNDTIEGGIGDDKLFGWSGEDSLIGGEGNDYLKAEDGADTLEGGEGEDTLNGGSGQDFLRGGKHADTYVLSFGNDTIKGYQKIDKITLSQEILDAGVDSNDIEIERTIIDEKEAAFLSFELKGIEHTTTVIGVNDAEYDYLQEDFDKTTETPNDELLTKTPHHYSRTAQKMLALLSSQPPLPPTSIGAMAPSSKIQHRRFNAYILDARPIRNSGHL